MPTTKGRLGSIVRTLVFVGLDIFLCFLFQSYHGSVFAWSNFSKQFSLPYSFLTSSIDFFILAIWRSVLLIVGCSILCLVKEPLQALTWGKHVIFSLCILFCTFSPTKLLALYENNNKPFFGDWALIFQNLIFSIFAHLLWNSYVRLSTAKDHSYQQLDEEEEEGTSFEEEDTIDDLGAPSSTSVVVIRLLQYCRDEWIWHLSGFTFLFIYSLTRIFVPYYTGQVIASVVSAEGDKYAALITAVKLMVAISVIS